MYLRKFGNLTGFYEISGQLLTTPSFMTGVITGISGETFLNITTNNLFGGSGYFSEPLSVSGTGAFSDGLTASTGFFADNYCSGGITSSTGYFNNIASGNTTGSTGYFNNLSIYNLEVLNLREHQ